MKKLIVIAMSLAAILSLSVIVFAQINNTETDKHSIVSVNNTELKQTCPDTLLNYLLENLGEEGLCEEIKQMLIETSLNNEILYTSFFNQNKVERPSNVELERICPNELLEHLFSNNTRRNLDVELNEIYQMLIEADRYNEYIYFANIHLCPSEAIWVGEGEPPIMPRWPHANWHTIANLIISSDGRRVDVMLTNTHPHDSTRINEATLRLLDGNWGNTVSNPTGSVTNREIRAQTGLGIPSIDERRIWARGSFTLTENGWQFPLRTFNRP